MKSTVIPPRFRNKPIAAAIILTCALLSAAQLGAQGEKNAASGNALTIYSSVQPGGLSPEIYRSGGEGHTIPGYAVVRHERQLDFNKGRNNIRFTDVAAQIDPTTVAFQSLTDPEGTRVVEQNFQFDLVSTQKLLNRFVDSAISVDQLKGNSVETVEGTLLSSQGGLVLRAPDGSVRVVNSYSGMKLPKLPGGLITRPTLVWDVAAKKEGSHRTRVSYQTGGITWWADYNLIFAEGKDNESCKLDVNAWVSIINQSGASYPEAKLKLIAGDVNRAAQPSAPRVMMLRKEAVMAADMAEPQFEEKTFFEYHLYTLSAPTTLPENSTKQIELFPTARDVDCERLLVYDGIGHGFGNYGAPMTDQAFGVGSNKKIDVFLTFKNAKQNNMGMPLPKGRVRVSKLDSADKTLEFVGEDAIDHTPKEEKVLIKLGQAFDVVGERRQVDFKVDTKRRWMEEEIEIKVRNQKEEAVKVIVAEHLYRWLNWDIIFKSQGYEKRDSKTIHFPVKLAKGAEGIVRYRVRYSW